MRTCVASLVPRKKGQRAHVLAAHVDVTLRLGSEPGAEGLDEAAIAGMAGWLRLAGTVVERAKEIFRKVDGGTVWRGIRDWTKLQSMDRLYAACHSIACRKEGSPRSLKELASATAEGGAEARKAIARLTKHIRARLGEEVAGRTTGVGLVRASSYLRHFCQVLGMGDGEVAVGAARYNMTRLMLTVAAAKQAARARRLEEIDLEVPHTGESIAAAVVCLALERTGADRPDVLWEVAAATSLSTVTINNVCKKLRPHAELLFG